MSYNEALQSLWRKYEEAHGEAPLTVQDCYDWASKQRLWVPRPQDVAKIFSREMSAALRAEYRVDPSGRKYRAKICVKEKIGPLQFSLWKDSDTAPLKFVQRHMHQRRAGIVNDCYQAKQDVDHFNEYRSDLGQISLILDFTDDVAELEATKKGSRDVA